MTTFKREPLSDEWRTQSSQVRAIDLANVLRSLQKVIGSMDAQHCDIGFNSTADSYFLSNNMSIKIDPKYALKSSPVIGEDFDVLAGLAVHEALHVLCESDRVLGGWANGIMESIVKIGEEIYIDNYGKRNLPVLGQYIHRGREAYKPPIDLVNWHDIFVVWGAIGIYGILPPNLDNHQQLVQLKLLMDLSEELTKQDLYPTARKKLYQETAEKLEALKRHEQIEEQLKEKPLLELDAPHGMTSKKPDTSSDDSDDSPDSDKPDDTEEEEDNFPKQCPVTGNDIDEDGTNSCPDDCKHEEETNNGDMEEEPDPTEQEEEGEPPTLNNPQGGQPDNTQEEQEEEETQQDGEDAGGEDEEESEEGEDDREVELINITDLFHPNQGELPPELEAAISQALDLEVEDITSLLQGVFVTEDDDPVIWSLADSKLDTNFNEQLARQLGWVREYKNTIGHQTYRNEPGGRLDATKLYRAPIDGLVFKRKQELPKTDLQLVMLLDASGSMSSRLDIYEDAKALFRALPDSIILSYDANNSAIQIKVHTQGRQFRQVEPRGSTPSGMALAATALKYPRSLIIHFTDGQSNHGNSPAKLIPQIHENYPEVRIVNIQMGNQRHLIGEVEGISKTVHLGKIEDFPGKLKEILRTW